eukprot:Sdes_comp19381_c0_seq1m10668
MKLILGCLIGWLSLLLVAEFVSSAPSDHERKASVYYREETGKYLVKFDVLDEAGSIAVGTFEDGLERTGWGILRIKTSKNYADRDQMFAAGYLEGALTAHRIYQHYQNMFPFYFGKSNSSDIQKYNRFFETQENWTNEMVKKNNQSSFWRQVGLVQSQFDGLVQGYQDHFTFGEILDRFAFFMLNAVGDLLDLKLALDKKERKDWDSFMEPDAGIKKNLTETKLKVALSTHCTALIKVLPDLSDILISHSSWFSYSAMNRIYKHYHFGVQESSSAVHKISFSSYPGFLESLDDFYLMDSGLVMVQTTNNVFNTKLYDNIVPTSLFAWQRVRVANSMASSGKEWADVIAQYNSGTYNNQYMIVDLKKFVRGKHLLDDTLWVVEQIPGLVESKDVTSILRNGYWGSWNVPFFENVYNQSGYPTFVEQHGLDFSYEMAPRAKIFRRDSEKVSDFETLKWFMRYNEYQSDRFSEKILWIPFVPEAI